METEQVKQHAITDVKTIDEWWQEVKDTPRMKSALRALLQARLKAQENMEAKDNGNEETPVR